MAARRLRFGDSTTTMSLSIRPVVLSSGLRIEEGLEAGLLTSILATETVESHQDELLEYIQSRLGVSLSLAMHLYTYWCRMGSIKRPVKAEAVTTSGG